MKARSGSSSSKVRACFSILYIPVMKREAMRCGVVNQVSGRLLSLIPMHVVLYGIARFLDADERAVAMQSCK